jgi:predicted dehydrogenase
MKKRKTSRREFLKSALSLSVPLFIPASVLGRNGNIPPSDRIGLAVIGLGNKGFRWTNGAALIQNFVPYQECVIRAVCDVDRLYLQDAKKWVDEYYGHSDCGAYTDFREILIRDDIDGVIITTPHHWHAHMTTLACEYGKDVYVEKPMSNSVEEAIAMVDAARRYGRIVQVGSQARSSPKITFACQMIQEGKIGEIKEVQVNVPGPPIPCNLPAEPVPDYLDWDLYLGPAPWRPYHSRMHPGSGRYIHYGGGGLTDWGHHFFDVAQWGLRMDHTGPVDAIPADGKEYIYPTFTYANGIRMKVSILREDRSEAGTVFYGSKGKIFIQAWEDVVEYEPQNLRYLYYEHAKSLKRTTPEVQLVNNHLVNFLDCIRTRQVPNADVAIGCNSVIIPHLAIILLRLNRYLRWDPDIREFINDDLANRYLSTYSRAPWRL